MQDVCVDGMNALIAAVEKQTAALQETNLHLGCIREGLEGLNRELASSLPALTEKLADLEPVQYFTDRDGVLMIHVTGRALEHIEGKLGEVRDACDGLRVAVEKRR